MKNKYQIMRLMMIMITCIFVGCFYILSNEKIGEIYKQNTEESIYNLKKIFLKDTVNNQIARIEKKRKDESESYQKLALETATMLNDYIELEPERFLDFYRYFFDQENNREIWTAALWEEETGEVVYDPKNLLGNKNAEDVVRRIKNNYLEYYLSDYGKYKAFFGVKKDYVDNLVKEFIAKEIHNSMFSEDSYIWVNEVVNYEGGDNYAIRRVHPNLPDTEGMSLSTKMTDIKGDFPYLEELEGVKNNGEIFFTYHFKKMNSEVVSEKIAYAKLYKDYDWIIAMGIHLDDMEAYIDRTNEESGQVVTELVAFLVPLLVVLLGFSFVILALIEKKRYRQSSKALQEEVNHDLLTNAFTRRAADKDFIKEFAVYQRNGISPAIIILDFDDFKSINDNYGHDVGDRILESVVHTIQGMIRSTDKIYRWGGDEFVVVIEGMKVEKVMALCNKILIEVAAVKYDYGTESVHTSISMGISYFKKNDINYTDALKRADTALYRSKSNGKGQINNEF